MNIRLLTIVQFPYSSVLDRQRSQILLNINVILMISWAIWLFIVAFPTSARGVALSIPEIIFAVASPLVAASTIALIQFGYVRIASWMIVIASSFIVSSLMVNTIFSVQVIYLSVVLVLGATLIGAAGVLAAALITGLGIFYGIVADIQAPPEALVRGDLVLGNLFSITIAGLIIAFVLAMIFRNIAGVMEQQGLQISDFERATGFATRIDTYQKEEVIAQETIQFIEDLGFRYAQVLLPDTGGTTFRRYSKALLRSSGQRFDSVLFPNDHPAYEALRTRIPYITTRNMPVNRRQHLLQDATHSIHIPMKYESQIIGILEVQLSTRGDISLHVKTLLQLIADQAASALYRLYVVLDLQQTLEDNRAVITRQEQQLVEISEQQYWQRFTRRQGDEQQITGFNYHLDDTSPVKALDMPDPIEQTIRSGEVSIQKVDNLQVIRLPIMSGSNSLGAIVLSVHKDQVVTKAQQELMRSVIERLVIALENRRLFEQSRAAAFRESTANEVGSQLLSSTDIRNVLNTASKQFSEVLGAIQTQIHLSPSLQIEIKQEDQHEQIES
ncbi:hypothetical protein MASR2M15_17550 [Anaerolineales bacterium]